MQEISESDSHKAVLGALPPLLGKSEGELRDIVKSLGMPAFVGNQIAKWLYQAQVRSFDEMSNISLRNRELLQQHFALGRYPYTQVQTSSDGTRKYLFETAQAGRYVETVFIPDGDRATLCVSSQVGCKMDCLFCSTGKQGFQANLSVAEILNQICSVDEAKELSNIVFMGMGEPLDNTDVLLKCCEILTSSWAWAWSPKRITVSTIGAKGLAQFLEQSRCHLALSLHNPFPSERMQIMPVEKAMPLMEVLQLLEAYDFSGQRRLSIEYIVFEGLNDSMRHADELARILRKLDCRINLIRYHQVPGIELKSPKRETMLAFQESLQKQGYNCTIRSSRGEDIAAACGMLSTKNRNK